MTPTLPPTSNPRPCGSWIWPPSADRPAPRRAARQASRLPGGPARPDQEVAYIDATGVAVFACQQPDGTYVIDICTRVDTADGRLRLLLDGQPLPGTPGDGEACPASHTTDRGAPGDGSPEARGEPHHATSCGTG